MMPVNHCILLYKDVWMVGDGQCLETESVS